MARKPTTSSDGAERAAGVARAAQNASRPPWLTSAALDLLSRAISSPRVDREHFGVHLVYELPDAHTPAGRDLIVRGLVEMVGGRPLVTVSGVISASLWREG